MLSHHLKSALSDLKDLIKITESDIADIKEAKNDPQFERLSLKEAKLINEEQHTLLDELKVELSNLREVNKHYAKLVLTVSNLYNTFLERLVPTEMQGYNKVASKNPSILEVRV